MRSELMDALMKGITFLGNGGMIWIIIATILLLWKRHRRCGAAMAVGLLSGLIIGNGILKNLLARSRPCWINTSVDLLIDIPLDYSLPSGHTLSSFVAATVLFSYNKAWGIAAYILASLIAFSRLYLYVHFPTDILVAIVLGIAIGLMANKVVDSAWPKIEGKIGF